jgi:uncharacterized repeat protein (TIGR03803 family)
MLGGANLNTGTVFEIVKTASGYASTPTILANFCSLANCADGTDPEAGLIADANGNLFGTTLGGGAHGGGSVFEVTDSGFVVPHNSLARREKRTAMARVSRRWPGNLEVSITPR